MPRKKVEKKEDKNEEVIKEQADEKEKEEVVDESSVVDKPVTKGGFPAVAGTGKFHAIQFKGGYVVYNPAGQRVSDALSLSEAGDIVRAQNAAAHIKMR